MILLCHFIVALAEFTALAPGLNLCVLVSMQFAFEWRVAEMSEDISVDDFRLKATLFCRFCLEDR